MQRAPDRPRSRARAHDPGLDEASRVTKAGSHSRRSGSPRIGCGFQRIEISRPSEAHPPRIVQWKDCR